MHVDAVEYMLRLLQYHKERSWGFYLSFALQFFDIASQSMG